MIASVGVWTRPSETTPPTHARPRIVAARVAFMPTSQSASERARAADSSGCDLRRRGAAARSLRGSPVFVIELIQRRSTGFGASALVGGVPKTDS